MPAETRPKFTGWKQEANELFQMQVGDATLVFFPSLTFKEADFGVYSSNSDLVRDITEIMKDATNRLNNTLAKMKK